MDSVKVMTDVQSDDELNTLRGEITRYEERVHTGGEPSSFIGLEEAVNRLEARLTNVLRRQEENDGKCAAEPVRLVVPILTARVRAANDWLDYQIGRILDITDRLDV
jgi:hypothetical protein